MTLQVFTDAATEGWCVRQLEGFSKTFGCRDTQEEAIELARREAEEGERIEIQGGRVVRKGRGKDKRGLGFSNPFR